MTVHFSYYTKQAHFPDEHRSLMCIRTTACMRALIVLNNNQPVQQLYAKPVMCTTVKGRSITRIHIHAEFVCLHNRWSYQHSSNSCLSFTCCHSDTWWGLSCLMPLRLHVKLIQRETESLKVQLSSNYPFSKSISWRSNHQMKVPFPSCHAGMCSLAGLGYISCLDPFVHLC